MTSYWAAATFGSHSRFTTQIFVQAVDGQNQVADVHIQGARDPFFDHQQFQFLIGKLNQMGVSRVRTLSFDENFVFAVQSRVSAVAVEYYELADPTISSVTGQLSSYFKNINLQYSTTRALAQQLWGMALPGQVSFSVQELRFLRSSDFSAGKWAQTFKLKSRPLVVLLKEMNRNSNNYVANILFQRLGGAAEFQNFIFQTLGLDESQIMFYNGSGDSLHLPTGKIYNQATCESMLTVIQALSNLAKSEGLALTDFLAVAGRGAENELSTLDKPYNNDITSDALVAKTGTIDPTVALAGMAATQKGNIFFAYLYTSNGTAQESTKARQLILQDVQQLFLQYGNKMALGYNLEKFLPFDRDSWVTVQTQSQTLPLTLH